MDRRPRSRHPRAAHGSSTVEFMLFLVVFIPIILYSLYITDALFDWLKAQEAAGAAAWEFSGELLHDYSGGYAHATKYSAAVSAVRTRLKARYTGLDGWDTAGPSKRVTPATSASLKSLDCQTLTSIKEPLESASAAFPSGLGAKLHTGGMVQCQSSVDILNVYFGGKPIEHYMDQPSQHWWSTAGGAVPLYSSRMLSAMTLCGVGTPRGGCSGNGSGFTLLTDDWGLEEDSGGGASTTDDDLASNWPDDTSGSDSNPHFQGLGNEFHKALGPGDSSWLPFDPTVDVQTDTEFTNFELAYQAETPTAGPMVGPQLDPSAPTVKNEGSYTQDSETFPYHHNALPGQSAADETLNADQGGSGGGHGRAEQYLGLP